MNIQNPTEESTQLIERLITDIMCILQLYPDFNANVYVHELGDYMVYTRYSVRKFQYNHNFYPTCYGTNTSTGEIRPISVKEISIESLLDIHKALTAQLRELPKPYTQYSFETILGDVMFLSKDQKLYYLFTANTILHFEAVKEGTILYTPPLATTKNYSIKFQRNCTDGFCIFCGIKHLESFWSYRAALQYMYQFTH